MIDWRKRRAEYLVESGRADECADEMLALLVGMMQRVDQEQARGALQPRVLRLTARDLKFLRACGVFVSDAKGGEASCPIPSSSSRLSNRGETGRRLLRGEGRRPEGFDDGRGKGGAI